MLVMSFVGHWLCVLVLLHRRVFWDGCTTHQSAHYYILSLIYTISHVYAYYFSIHGCCCCCCLSLSAVFGFELLAAAAAARALLLKKLAAIIGYLLFGVRRVYKKTKWLSIMKRLDISFVRESRSHQCDKGDASPRDTRQQL